MEPSQLFLAFCVGAPFAAAAAVLAAPRYASKLGASVVVASLALSTVSSLALFAASLSTGRLTLLKYPLLPSLGAYLSLRADLLATAVALLVSLLSALIAVYSMWYMHDDGGLTRYWFFYAFFVGGMLLLVLSDNLLLFLVGWECTSLASFALIGHWYTDEDERCVGELGHYVAGTPMFSRPTESALKALLFTRLGDAVMLVGLALVYSAAGTFEISELATSGEWVAKLAVQGVLPLAVLAVLTGAFAKSAQLPFSEWLVTAMTGPTPVSALIHSATMVNAGVYLAIRFIPAVHAASELAHVKAILTGPLALVALVGALTALLGGLQALVAREYKLILAHSTASQLGYMFAAIGLGGIIGHVEIGVLAALMHMYSQALFKAPLFMAAGNVIHVVGSRFIDDCGALAGPMKFSSATTLLALCSLIGLFPFAGFWSKELILHLSLESASLLAAVMLIGGAIVTVLYSSRLFIRVFMMEASEKVRALMESEKPPADPGILAVAPPLALSAACLGVGLLIPMLSEPFLASLVGTTPGLAHVEYVPAIDPALFVFSVIAAVYGGGATFFLYAMDRKLLARAARGPARPFYLILRDRLYIYPLIYQGIALPMHYMAGALASLVEGALDTVFHGYVPLAVSKLSLGARRYFDALVDRGLNIRVPSAARYVATTLASAFDTFVDVLFNIRAVTATKKVSAVLIETFQPPGPGEVVELPPEALKKPPVAIRRLSSNYLVLFLVGLFIVVLLVLV